MLKRFRSSAEFFGQLLSGCKTGNSLFSDMSITQLGNLSENLRFLNIFLKKKERILSKVYDIENIAQQKESVNISRNTNNIEALSDAVLKDCENVTNNPAALFEQIVDNNLENLSNDHCIKSGPINQLEIIHPSTDSELSTKSFDPVIGPKNVESTVISNTSSSIDSSEVTLSSSVNAPLLNCPVSDSNNPVALIEQSVDNILDNLSSGHSIESDPSNQLEIILPSTDIELSTKSFDPVIGPKYVKSPVILNTSCVIDSSEMPLSPSVKAPSSDCPIPLK